MKKILIKKILFISGLFTVLLLPLLLTGWADTDDKVKDAIRKGNRQYESAYYNEALKLYELGLAEEPENKVLNFNSAQAAYILTEYEKSLEYYGKAEDCTEKFLNAGNICFRAGDAVQDANEKVQYYSQAMQIYRDGIIKYPQDIPLKYNYELVKKKLEELLQEQEQNQEQEQEQESENSEESQENQEQNSEQGENSEENGKDEEGKEAGEEKEQNQQQETGEEEKEQNQQQETGEEEKEQNQQQEGEDEQQESYSQNEGEGEDSPDQETVERILQMLENQEEESLKNNQEVVGGNEGKYGW